MNLLWLRYILVWTNVSLFGGRWKNGNLYVISLGYATFSSFGIRNSTFLCINNTLEGRWNYLAIFWRTKGEVRKIHLLTRCILGLFQPYSLRKRWLVERIETISAIIFRKRWHCLRKRWLVERIETFHRRYKHCHPDSLRKRWLVERIETLLLA